MNASPARAFGVSVGACEAGWIDLLLRAGPQERVVHFSAVFDPLPELLAWLEAVVLGARESAFSFDEEGRVCTFRMTRLEALPDRADGVLFTVRDDACGERAESAWSVEVPRRALVRAMYGSITAFARSDRFDPREWDALRVGDDSSDEAWALGAGHGGTPLAGWRSERVERWLACGAGGNVPIIAAWKRP